VVQKIHDAFKKAVEDPGVIATLEKLDMAPRYMDTATYQKFAMDTIKQEKELIERLGLKRS
jgi:tripartite-type tricarboxylate transporter receptor subunit TctC